MKSLINLLLAGFFILGACTSGGKDSTRDAAKNVDEQIEGEDGTFNEANEKGGMEAIAVMSAASGSEVQGTVSFVPKGDDVIEMRVSLQKLSPGKHAIHLHEKNDCTAEDASSAGGHWNPTMEDHGQRENHEFHQGDLNNLEVGLDGLVEWTGEVRGWTIGGPDSTNILEKSVIVHAGADDYTTQPSGNAGGRIACGVIGLK